MPTIFIRKPTSPRWPAASHLTDDDRWPWLDAIVAAMHERAAHGDVSVVIACSALKDAYRQRLAPRWMATRRGPHRLSEGRRRRRSRPRLASRSGHYMPAALLASQFAALEEPPDAIVVDIRPATEEQVAANRRRAAFTSRFGRMTDQPKPDAATPGTGDRGRASGARARRHLGASIRRSIARRRSCSTRSPTTKRRSAASRSSLIYGLRGLPTVTDLQAAVATLEGGYAALAVPSGLAATTLAFARADQRRRSLLLVTDSVYGPTRRFCDNQLTRFGVTEVSYYDPLIGERHRARDAAEHARRLRRVARFAELRGAGRSGDRRASRTRTARWCCWTIPGRRRSIFAPSTTASMIAVMPEPSISAAIPIVLIGLIVCNEASLPRLHRLWTDIGVTASSDDCFLALRGLRTLAVRLERHQAQRLQIASWLRDRPEVAEVIYPALPDARGHELWKRDFTGACGLFGVILRPVPKARVDAMLDGLRYFKMGVSWGGFESLILPIHRRRAQRDALESWRTLSASARWPRRCGRPDRRSGRWTGAPSRLIVIPNPDTVPARRSRAQKLRRFQRDGSGRFR